MTRARFRAKREMSMKTSAVAAVLVLILAAILTLVGLAQAKSYVAYISDSPASASAYWVTKDAGFFKKHGLDVDLIFIDGSSRGIQSLMSGDIPFTSGRVPLVVENREGVFSRYPKK